MRIVGHTYVYIHMYCSLGVQGNLMSNSYSLPRDARGRCRIRSSFLLMARTLQVAVWVAAKPQKRAVKGSPKKSRSGPSGWQAWKTKKAAQISGVLAAPGETRVVVKQESPAASQARPDALKFMQCVSWEFKLLWAIQFVRIT